MEEVKVEKLNDAKCKVIINIPADKVDSKTEEFLKSVKSEAKIPGFRKGKVPVSYLKEMLGQKVRVPVSQMIINEYYSKVLQEHNINPVSSPVFDDLKAEDTYVGFFDFDNSYSVSFTLEVLPEVDPVGYKGLEIDIPDINEKELYDKKMLEYREQFAERKQVNDRGAKVSDTVIIDFAGYIDGEPLDGGSADNYTIDKLGQSNFIPGFEDQLVSMKVGDNKKIKVKFPEQYHAKFLAGKEAEFEVKMNNIIENKLAKIDDDLAMMVGHSSLEELKNEIEHAVKEERKTLTRQSVDANVFDKLIENNKFDVPKSMVDQERNRLLSNINNKDNVPQQVLSEIDRVAEKNVKRAILIEAIYEKENELEIAPEELSDLLEQHAKANNQTKDELVSALYNANQMDNFVGVLRSVKVLDFIIEHVKKESEEVDGQQ